MLIKNIIYSYLTSVYTYANIIHMSTHQVSTHQVFTQVSTLEFRKNIYKYLDRMPLKVTAKGETVFYVVKNLNNDVSTDESIEGSTESNTESSTRGEKIIQKKSVEVCKHGYAYGLCKFGCEK